MSAGSDNKSALSLSNPQGAEPQGQAALGNKSSEDEIPAHGLQAVQQQRIRQLERNMADREAQQIAGGNFTSRKSRHVAHAQGWKAICTEPDYCKVGKDIIAFNSFATLDQKQKASENVRAKGTSTYRKGDIIRQVQADAGKHILSGTSLAAGHVHILEGHDTVKVNGLQVARHDSRCLINCDTNGIGGAKGKLVTTEKTENVEDSGDKRGSGARPNSHLEHLKLLRAALQPKQVDLDSLDGYVDFQRADKSLTKLIGSMYAVPGIAPEKLQVIRGLLGFSKDVALGTGELAYEALKALPKLAQRTLSADGRLLNGINAQILAENIRLGNFSAGTAKDSLLEIGKHLVEPVSDPWSRKQYIEAVTRATAEIATLGTGLLKGGKFLRFRNIQPERTHVLPPAAKGGVHVAKKPAFSGDWKKYNTQGLKVNPMASAEGRDLVASLEKKGMSHVEAVDEARILMKSGSTYPMANPVEVGDRFYKVLDDAGNVSAESPFWITEKQLSELSGLSYEQIADRLGMPLASQQGQTLKVMEITAFRPSRSYSSMIAPTSEIGANGTVWVQKGGGTQTLLTDRSAFTTPRATGIRLP